MSPFPSPSSLLPSPTLRSPASGLRLSFLVLAALLAAASGHAQGSASATVLNDSLKKITARFPRTEERIKLLVGRRLDPQPLPRSLPNPFYRGVETSELATLDVTTPDVPEAAPAAPDITDADTLARLAPTLRISGLVSLSGVPHVAINSLLCKVGDVIPVSGRDVPVFLQVRRIAPHEITLGLNEAELTIPVKL